jgi:hypothetical protein
MPRRIWVAEGVASDGDIYGRALRLPDRNGHQHSASHGGATDVERRRGSVLKSHLGDIPSCPCLAALVPQDQSGTSAGVMTDA